MKKIGILMLTLLSILFLTSCQSTIYKPEISEDKTNFEELKAYVDEFDLDIDPKDVKNNLSLPKRLSHPLMVIEWISNKPEIINSEGHVNRPESNLPSEEVRLTAIFTLGSSQIRKHFDLTVKPKPSNDLNLLEEDLETLFLYPSDIITRDYLILPRVTNSGSYLKWTTSDASVIDLDGNVYLPTNEGEEKEVVLTVEISRGEFKVFKDFNFKVQYQKPSIEVINQEDNRILRTKYVTTKIELISALNDVKPGDAIILKEGRYEDVNITVTKSGTEENPIFIFGDPNGNTMIQGESFINIKANHVILANLTFNEGSPSSDRGVVWLEGDYLRLTNTKYHNYEKIGNDYKWVSLTGKYHEIDRNTFMGKKTGGSLLTIWRDNTDFQMHHIHHNVFRDYKNAGGQNGYETIRIGTSTHSQSDAYLLVEDNLFEDVNGEIEIISVKSGRNIIRNNTFLRSLGHITLRHGKNNVVSNNVFKGEMINDTGGIRIYDAGHIVTNNYIEKITSNSNTRGGIVIHSGVNIPGESTVLNAQWTPYNVLVSNNTIYQSKQSILFEGKYSQISKDIYLSNNLIVSATGVSALRHDKNHTSVFYENENYYSDTAYSSGGAFIPLTIPAGVTYRKESITLTPIEGIYLHPEMGAKNISQIKTNEVGVIWDRNK